MAGGWMTVWRLDTGEQKIRKDAVKMVKQRFGGDITKESEENANRGVERGLRGAKGNVWRGYHFRSDPRRDNAPSALRDFVPLTAGESIGERRDRRQKKMRRDAREIS